MINKKNIFQITIAVALGGLLFGYDTAVISGRPILYKFISNYLQLN